MTQPPADAGRDPEPVVRIRPFLKHQLPAESPALREHPAGQAEVPSEEILDRGLRPFVLTSGRVDAVDPAINLETQVTVHLEGRSWTQPMGERLTPELRQIIALCAEPISVAEISAKLRLHLGVTKILVADLRAGGYLDVHTDVLEDPFNADIILRVIDGLRAIS